MKTIYALRAITLMVIGLSTMNLLAGNFPEFKKKEPVRHMKKFTEVKKQLDKTLAYKNTYIITNQMLHLWNGEDYDTTYSMDYEYVWSTLMSQILTKEYYNGTFENSNLETHFRDEKGRDTTVLQQYWVGDKSGWMNSWKEVFFYDNYDNEVFNAGYYWDQDAWVLYWGSDMVHEYDAFGRIISTTYSNYSWNTWELAWKDIFEYDNNGLLISITELEWDDFDEEWYNAYREEYHYQNNAWTDVYGFYWDDWDEEWVEEFWATDIIWLNFENLLWEQVIMKEHDGMNWINYERGTASYNSVFLPLMIQFELWYDGEWLNNWRYIWDYDNFNNVTLMADQVWTGSEWEIMYGHKFTFEYDGNNNIAIEYLEVFAQPVKYWEKIHKLESWYEDVTGIPSAVITPSVVNVFPNPAGSYINLQVIGAHSAQPLQYQILDLTGRTVITGTISISEGASAQLNIQEIPEGMYIVRVESGNKIENIKIIKK